MRCSAVRKGLFRIYALAVNDDGVRRLTGGSNDSRFEVTDKEESANSFGNFWKIRIVERFLVLQIGPMAASWTPAWRCRSCEAARSCEDEDQSIQTQQRVN